MGVSFSVIWSSAFTSARILVTSAPPLMVLSVRFLISGLLGIALARMMGQKIELERKEWLGVVIIGICQNALYLGLNFIGMQWIEAGLAAIIASTLPLIVAIFCWLFLGEKTKMMGLLG
ncbi:MAG: DMT family transporter, partial [SAR324 cluster bacterium]|nr:DMT family transporter [SAR324 cluster bacterium]